MAEKVIDDFLVYYAAEKEGFSKKINADFDKFKHIIHEFSDSHLSFLKTEIIVSKIFTKNGLIKKYLNHSAVKKLPADQYEFLRAQSQVPWKFSYSVILNNPSENFYEMEDVFTGEQYLLYSPGMKSTIETTSPILWFNLIGFNGVCWQTYGLIIGFKSFSEDDIFFFATELNTSISDEDDLINEVENNPIPFFMLLIGSQIPMVLNKNHQISNLSSVDELKNFSTEPFKNQFDIAWNESVFQLKLKKWEEFPHFAVAYYDETEKIMARYAMTEKGFFELTKSLNKAGFRLDTTSDISVGFSMIKTTTDILKKEITINPYEELFDTDNEEEDDGTNLDNHNAFLDLAIPFLNKGITPDIEAMAHQAGIDLPTALNLWGIVNKEAKKMRKK
jgi:hypothetical protein